ncbi:MAG: FtsW/RodA/SpoVE family cell cycle protein [Spirulinaceae cyanobacterium SM2_1_0]|nr:FtsW/RodA/SpoVE family cell cycle protein [Spirulinaceae cyanobacterium SM2_1_0]
MLQPLRQIIPFFNPNVLEWSAEARLLRWLTLLWLGIGLVVLFSASYPVADAEFGDGLYYFKRQILWAFLGLIGFSVLVRTPLRYVTSLAQWGYLLLVGVLLIVLIPGVGTTVNGATRWLAIGSLPLQPSELIKPLLVLQCATVFSNWSRLRWPTRLFWLGVFTLTVGGILLQPNLSTAALCGLAIWLIALTAGLPWLQMLATAGGGMVLALISIGSQDYQRRRIMSFLDPWADPMHDGYQLIQSLLAVGSGGLWGTGFGLSQQKLFYLPIQYTDFIFAVFAEEFGLVGSFLLLLLLLTYATFGLVVALKSPQAVQQLTAVGVTVFLVGQSLINIGVATGALPTTGLPLPLFSYGGSSLIASLILAGLLVRVAREGNEAEVVSLQARRQARNRGSRRSLPPPQPLP